MFKHINEDDMPTLTKTKMAQYRDYVSQAFSVQDHIGHERLCKITLSKRVILGFLEDVKHTSVQSLEYIPYNRFVLADILSKHAGPRFSEILNEIIHDRNSGGFVIGLNDLTFDESDYVKFGTAIGHLIGASNHDHMSNAYYARFVVEDTDASDSFLRQAYRLFTLHTDGTFVAEATDWLLMMKFSETNSIGGETRILHLDDWTELETFRSNPLGGYEFEYKAPGSKNINYTVQRPLFFENKYGLCVSFIDQFVHPETIEQAKFLKDFSNSLETSTGTTEISVPSGNLVVLNNHFWLHGRAAFQKHEDLHRELMRQRGLFPPTKNNTAVSAV